MKEEEKMGRERKGERRDNKIWKEGKGEGRGKDVEGTEV